MARLVHVGQATGPLWVTLAGYLQPALVESGAERDWGLEDVAAAAQRQEVDLWVLMEGQTIFGACTTAVYTYSRSKVVDVALLGTEPHHEQQWRECLEQLKALARGLGAYKITGTGRPGWARKLGASERRVFEIEV